MLVQTNRHGLPMPPTPTALLVIAIVASIWAVVMFAAGFVVAATVVAGLAIVCAALSLAQRNRPRTPRPGSVPWGRPGAGGAP